MNPLTILSPDDQAIADAIAREARDVAWRYDGFQEKPAYRCAEAGATFARPAPVVLRWIKDAIDAGELDTADDLKTIRYGEDTIPRRNWATVLLDRRDVREWIATHRPELSGTHLARWSARDIA